MSTTDNFSWASDALNTIADASAVAICVNLLCQSHVHNIQELVINLISQLVAVSEDARYQMFDTPNIEVDTQVAKPENKDKRVMLANNTKNSGNNISQRKLLMRSKSKNDVVKTIQTNSRISQLQYILTELRTAYDEKTAHKSILSVRRKYTCLSHLFAVITHHRNHYMVMSGCADIILVLLYATKSATLSEVIARTPLFPLETLKQQQTSNSTPVRLRRCRTSQASLLQLQPQRNLSATAGLTNRHGNINISTIRSEFQESKFIYPSKASLTSFVGHKHTKTDDKAREHSKKLRSWAGFCLLVGFLKRYRRYIYGEHREQRGADEGGGGNNNNNNNASKKLVDMIDDAAVVSKAQRAQLVAVHGRVFLAVCEMISLSPAVASFAITYEDTVESLKTYHQIHMNSPIIQEAYTRCGVALKAEWLEMEKREVMQYHSNSYEVSHNLPRRHAATVGSIVSSPQTASKVGGGGGSGEGASKKERRKWSYLTEGGGADQAAVTTEDSHSLYDPPSQTCSRSESHQRRWEQTLRDSALRDAERSFSPNRSRSSSQSASMVLPSPNYSRPLTSSTGQCSHVYSPPTRPYTAPDYSATGSSTLSHPPSPFKNGLYEVRESPTRRGLNVELVGTSPRGSC